MSSGGAQANKFYEEVASKKSLWFAEDSKGSALEFDISEDRVSFPLWSSSSRILRLKKLNPDFLGDFQPREISWEFFLEVLVPILDKKERLVGINYSGQNLSGFDMPIDQLMRQMAAFK